MTVLTNAIGLLSVEIDSAGSLKQAGDRVLFGAGQSSRAETEWLTRQKVAQCRENMATIVHQHGGIVADNTGDKMLCHLPDAKSALDTASDIQRAQQALEIGSEGAENVVTAPLGVRLAAHFGPLEVDGGKLKGDALRVIETILKQADPEQILVTQELVDSLEAGQPVLPMKDLGNLSSDASTGPIRIYEVNWEAVPETPPLVSLDSHTTENFEGLSTDPPPGEPAVPSDAPEEARTNAQATAPASGSGQPTEAAYSGDPRLTLRFKGKKLTLSRAQPSLMLRSGRTRAEHAKIRLDGSQFVVENLNPNGTLIRHATGQEEICLGTTTLSDLGAISLVEDFSQTGQIIQYTVTR